jgi:hypothetical protein
MSDSDWALASMMYNWRRASSVHDQEVFLVTPIISLAAGCIPIDGNRATSFWHAGCASAALVQSKEVTEHHDEKRLGIG